MNRTGRDSGFTLVEMAVVLAVTIIGVSAISQAFLSLQSIHAQEETRLELVQGLRIAADRMTSELRQAREFSLAEETAVEFTADTGSGDARIRYYRLDPDADGSPPFYLYRAVNHAAAGDGQPLATLIESSWSSRTPPEPAIPRIDFRYYDAHGDALTAPLTPANRARISRIGLTLHLENLEDGDATPVPHVGVFGRWSVTPRCLR